MTRDEIIAQLTADGNLLVPCSRYGRNSAECAEVAADACAAYAEETGNEITPELAEELMGYVVNDSDSIAHLLGDVTRYDWAYKAAKESAERLGTEAGTAAGEWFFDGNSHDESYVVTLRGLEDGDPEVLDTLPFLDLSGEWADSPNERDILREVLDDADASLDLDGENAAESATELIDAYRDAYDTALREAIETAARNHVHGAYLDSFVTGYIECALWSSITEDGTPLDENYGEDDLAPEARESMVDECASFLAEALGLIVSAKMTPDQAGQDFWLTRNHHGAGFWDRGLGATGKELTRQAQAYGGSDLYVGNDGRLYV